jgi:KDEL-tailed cysteine endopeptidase
MMMTMMANRVLLVVVFPALLLGCMMIHSNAFNFPSMSLPKSEDTQTIRLRSEFETFASKHGKTYASREEADFRFKVFSENVIKIEEHNKKEGETFKMGINMFTDMTSEEFSARNTLKRSSTPPMKAPSSLVAGVSSKGIVRSAVPTEKNWVTEGRVGSVRNQGQCGACWAFATIATIESGIAIAQSTTDVLDLSEQQLVDCDVNGNDNGCGGMKSIILTYCACFHQSNVLASIMIICI